ncbi:MAG: patatin-like phospholipase family protein [bacterium]
MLLMIVIAGLIYFCQDRRCMMPGDRPKVGLALSAGALRGFCHLGVLQVLDAEGIPVDYIAGSSIGALIGAFYAAGFDMSFLSRIAKHLRLRHIVDPTFPRQGFLLGQKINDFLRLFFRDTTFEQLKVPLAVVATDLRYGKEVVFKEGSVIDAIRASIAIPGIFAPVYQNDQVLVDGGLVNRVPVSIVREMGADIVIAVKINLPVTAQRLRNVADIIMQSFDLMQVQVMEHKMLAADIIIEPNVAGYSRTGFEHVEQCVEAGIVATRIKLPLFKSLCTKYTSDSHVPKG